jgi:hypothetical protein
MHGTEEHVARGAHGDLLGRGAQGVAGVVGSANVDAERVKQLTG